MKVAVISAVVAVVIAHSLTNKAYSKEWEVNNKVGGKIVLTDQKCPRGANYGKLAYNYDASGTMGRGCWALKVRGARVLVVWFNGNANVYPADIFRAVN